MNSIVSITLSGNLTKDATFKAYEDKGVINFSFAVNEPGKRQDDGTYTQKTTYCNAALWINSNEGSPLLDSLKKGKSITIFADRMPEIDVKVEGDKTYVNRNYTVKDIAL
ncbi:single-stranded DNA-binding protein [Elizabethkingia miricola]|uniref:single-stranded DNA-binding protein n=1 Tax=Elizabethkingia miricola TaxID=172045 RepID=UPI00099AAE83|nr:single-stranded DNA-binding protein [Elizabethkingia miricola]OPC06805.1 hypothetical protein BAY01_18455 [Elizabethkingia miricola]